MTQRTCNIIVLCKNGNANTKLLRIAQYMSQECYCPIDVYLDDNHRVLDKIIFDAMCDYIDGCEYPSGFLKTLAELHEKNSTLSNSQIIADAFSLVRVYDSVNYVDGFTCELCQNAKQIAKSINKTGN